MDFLLATFMTSLGPPGQLFASLLGVWGIVIIIKTLGFCKAFVNIQPVTAGVRYLQVWSSYWVDCLSRWIRHTIWCFYGYMVRACSIIQLLFSDLFPLLWHVDLAIKWVDHSDAFSSALPSHNATFQALHHLFYCKAQVEINTPFHDLLPLSPRIDLVIPAFECFSTFAILFPSHIASFRVPTRLVRRETCYLNCEILLNIN